MYLARIEDSCNLLNDIHTEYIRSTDLQGSRLINALHTALLLSTSLLPASFKPVC